MWTDTARLPALSRCHSHRSSKIPDNVSFLEAAYAEPIAATLAVFKAGIQKHDKGLIYGKNRFSQLMLKIFAAKGYGHVDVFDHKGKDAIDSGAYDFVVETMATTESMAALAKAVRPGGKIILKSRQFELISIRLTDLLKKEPTLHAVNYGSFDEALDMLTRKLITIDDLVDGIYPLREHKRIFELALREHKRIFELARGAESQKPFFDLAAV